MASFFFFYSLLCFVFLSQSFSSSSVHHLCSPSEASDLFQFKKAFGISDDYFSQCRTSFSKTTSWNESRDCCTWDGVTCDLLTGRVIGLDLSCSQLYRIIHPNSSLFQLHHLQRLNLANNFLNYSSIPNDIGQIPNSVGNLIQIRELDLHGNHFAGHIPSTISNLKQLTFLDLSSNSLGGEIPNVFSNLQELVVLDLSDNSLNGTIPSWVFSLPSLNILNLHHNQFTRVADELKTNPTLERLDLSHNQLSGPFLQSLENLFNLIFLGLSSNNMDAGVNITFPSLAYLSLSSWELKAFLHLRNSKTLKYLDLSNNKIDGPIPNWFNGMRWDSLLLLKLSYNSLTGHIEQLHYHSLDYLDLKFNLLQGRLPSSIYKLKNLTLLDLSHNHFNESVPHCLGSMTWVKVLNLRRNNFASSLPPLCTQSALLYTIALNGNRFEGPIPMSLLKCNRLEIFNVGNNAINDTFPAWLGTLEWLLVLILKSNKFHGPISTRPKFCFPKLRIFDLSHNEFNGSLPAEVFKT
ncbi:receptor-like protein Cf-9 [Lycium barbarum]|uniref:receptor-like protein Cf-9 n=1 Tax=Lycium barbarum TaxID=112863 RepID=UPI00293ED91A|nr:receptor-like protein Cf-9 [Lycium barbarum]